MIYIFDVVGGVLSQALAQVSVFNGLGLRWPAPDGWRFNDRM